MILQYQLQGETQMKPEVIFAKQIITEADLVKYVTSTDANVHSLTVDQLVRLDAYQPEEVKSEIPDENDQRSIALQLAGLIAVSTHHKQVRLLQFANNLWEKYRSLYPAFFTNKKLPIDGDQDAMFKIIDTGDQALVIKYFAMYSQTLLIKHANVGFNFKLRINSPIVYAAKKNRWNFVEIMLEVISRMDKLNPVAIDQLMLEKLLAIAARHKRHDLVKRLLEMGVPAAARDYDCRHGDKFALDWALLNNDSVCIDLLLAFGANMIKTTESPNEHFRHRYFASDVSFDIHQLTAANHSALIDFKYVPEHVDAILDQLAENIYYAVCDGKYYWVNYFLSIIKPKVERALKQLNIAHGTNYSFRFEPKNTVKTKGSILATPMINGSNFDRALISYLFDCGVHQQPEFFDSLSSLVTAAFKDDFSKPKTLNERMGVVDRLFDIFRSAGISCKHDKAGVILQLVIALIPHFDPTPMNVDAWQVIIHTLNKFNPADIDPDSPESTLALNGIISIIKAAIRRGCDDVLKVPVIKACLDKVKLLAESFKDLRYVLSHPEIFGRSFLRNFNIIPELLKNNSREQLDLLIDLNKKANRSSVYLIYYARKIIMSNKSHIRENIDHGLYLLSNVVLEEVSAAHLTTIENIKLINQVLQQEQYASEMRAPKFQPLWNVTLRVGFEITSIAQLHFLLNPVNNFYLGRVTVSKGLLRQISSEADLSALVAVSKKSQLIGDKVLVSWANHIKENSWELALKALSHVSDIHLDFGRDMDELSVFFGQNEIDKLIRAGHDSVIKLLLTNGMIIRTSEQLKYLLNPEKEFDCRKVIIDFELKPEDFGTIDDFKRVLTLNHSYFSISTYKQLVEIALSVSTQSMEEKQSDKKQHRLPPTPISNMDEKIHPVCVFNNAGTYQLRIWLNELIQYLQQSGPVNYPLIEPLIARLQNDADLIDRSFETVALQHVFDSLKTIRHINTHQSCQFSQKLLEIIGNGNFAAITSEMMSAKIAMLVDAVKEYRQATGENFYLDPSSKINQLYFAICWIIAHSSKYPFNSLLPVNPGEEVLETLTNIPLELIQFDCILMLAVKCECGKFLHPRSFYNEEVLRKQFATNAQFIKHYHADGRHAKIRNEEEMKNLFDECSLLYRDGREHDSRESQKQAEVCRLIQETTLDELYEFGERFYQNSADYKNPVTQAKGVFSESLSDEIQQEFSAYFDKMSVNEKLAVLNTSVCVPQQNHEIISFNKMIDVMTHDGNSGQFGLAIMQWVKGVRDYYQPVGRNQYLSPYSIFSKYKPAALYRSAISAKLLMNGNYDLSGDAVMRRFEAQTLR